MKLVANSRKGWLALGIAIAMTLYLVGFGAFLKVFQGTQSLAGSASAAPERLVYFSQSNGMLNGVGKLLYYPPIFVGEAFGWWRFVDITDANRDATNGPCLLVYLVNS